MRNNKRGYLLIGLALFLLLSLFLLKSFSKQVKPQNSIKKDYQVESNKVIVLDTHNKKELSTIDLSIKEGDFTIQFVPHDTITNKKFVWVSATASQKQLGTLNKELLKKSDEDHHIMMATDQIFVVDASTDRIVKKIPIGVRLDLADIIVTPDGRYAYISAEMGNAIYKINTNTYKVDLIQLPPESKPHQLALSTNGTKLYTRNAAKNKIFFVATKTNEVRNQEDTEVIRNITWSSH